MRPRIVLNCAVSRDGHLAGEDGQPVLLSDEEDLRRVHGMRASADAILVGVGTVLADDPSLRVKPQYAQGEDPLRVVLDSRLRTPATARVVDGSAPTVVYHAVQAKTRVGHADLVRVPLDAVGVDLHAVLADLADRAVELLLVEGGAQVLAAFLEAGLWDEWTVYEAPVDLGSGPALPSPSRLRQWGVAQASAVARGEGWLRTYAPQ